MFSAPSPLWLQFDRMGDLRRKVRAELGSTVSDAEFARWRLLKVGYGAVCPELGEGSCAFLLGLPHLPFSH